MSLTTPLVHALVSSLTAPLVGDPSSSIPNNAVTEDGNTITEGGEFVVETPA